ncbi:putative protein kinase RLK-Pelle-WAK family [Helianthus annuus]|nr:putative protein kinase RLK-Pelle-WAK family [Helianthus annuus]
MFQSKPMKLPNYYVLIIFFSITTATTKLVPRYAKPGCNEKCGNLTIPYPFGIGPNCFLNRWYAVNCKSSKPYLSALKQLPLLGVNLYEQVVLVNIPVRSYCQAHTWNSSQILNLGDSPFLFSKFNNKFFFEGCGTVAVSSGGNAVTGCSVIRCEPHERLNRSSCDEMGTNCCQTNVPYYLKNYSMNVTSNQSCVSAFLVADVGTTLELKMGLHTSVFTGKCSCPYEFNEGNPYLSGECKVTEECTKCMEMSGFCVYKVSYGGRRTFICDQNVDHHGRSKSRAAFLGVGITILVLFLTALGIVLYKVIQRTKDKRLKKICFERNGGLLLKQQEARNEGLVGETRIFTSNELEKATNYFNKNMIIGRGGQGTVYKGKLNDGRMIAVKKANAVDQSQLKQFINEMVILSQVNHRNVVKLLGCCLETDVPILVSEFISNGTLYEHIHHENTRVILSWSTRLQIAIEVAGALAYLHSAMSIPIYHRDIKSTNILLDEEYRAKISDFGTSRFVSIGVTHLSTLVQGTIGYLDPEYFQCSQLTEKSDVYSFGVVLVELLTGEKPFSSSRFGENRSLAAHFLMGFEEGRVMSILDANMVREGGRDVLLEVANLAIKCLNLCGKDRPTMKELAIELERVGTSQKSFDG